MLWLDVSIVCLRFLQVERHSVAALALSLSSLAFPVLMLGCLFGFAQVPCGMVQAVSDVFLPVLPCHLLGNCRQCLVMSPFAFSDACLSYVLEFLAKTESSNPLPRSFLVKSLLDFAAGLDADLLLCPVRAVWLYIRMTSFSSRPQHFFVSSHSLSLDVKEWYFLFPSRGYS